MSRILSPVGKDVRPGDCEGAGELHHYADVPVEQLLDPSQPGYRELLERCVVEEPKGQEHQLGTHPQESFAAGD